MARRTQVDDVELFKSCVKAKKAGQTLTEVTKQFFPELDPASDEFATKLDTTYQKVNKLKAMFRAPVGEKLSDGKEGQNQPHLADMIDGIAKSEDSRGGRRKDWGAITDEIASIAEQFSSDADDDEDEADPAENHEAAESVS